MTDTNTPTPRTAEICPRCGFVCNTVSEWLAHFSLGETRACFAHMKTRMAELKGDLAARDAELARLNAIPQIHSDNPWKARALIAEADLAAANEEARIWKARAEHPVKDAEWKPLALVLQEQLAAREEELAQWTKWGVIEVMIRNPNIASFVKEKEAELAEARAGTPHSKMVDRFLGWQLPKDFAPDCGISFDGRPKDAMGYAPSWPVGTNLFTADQALAMFRHCVPTVTQDSEFHPDWSMLEATRDALREVSEELARVKAERDLWQNAVIDGCVTRHIYTKEHDTDPRRALNDCAVWDHQVALDPAVSKDAEKLRDTYKAERDEAVRDAERYRHIFEDERFSLALHSDGKEREYLDSKKDGDAAIDAAREGK